MATTNDLTFEVLEKTIRDFFSDYFERLDVKRSESPKMPVLSSEVEPPNLKICGYRGKWIYTYTFFMEEWFRYFKNGEEYHQLENIKGETVRSEQTILLEHQKAAQ